MRLPLLAWSCSLLFPVLAASCSNNDDSAPPETIAGATIGPEGGSVAVTSGPLAGASITIPPGALTATVEVSFFEDQVTLAPGIKDVGPPLRIEPEGLELLLPALLTLPFDTALVPPTVTTEDYLVRYRLVDGRVFEALPRQVDPSLGRATLDVLQFATCWVSVPDEIETRAYLPLGGGDSYEYDSGLRLTVAETRTEPNFLGIPLTKLTFSTPFLFFSGLYLVDDAEGALSLFGEFDVGTENRQERLDGAAPLLDAVEPVGSQHELFYSFTGFIPFGSPLPAYLGAAHATVSIVQRTSLATLAGTFEDVVVLELAIERGDSRPRSSQGTLRFWLANGVGPVQVQEDQLPPHRLVSAVVGGVRIP